MILAFVLGVISFLLTLALTPVIRDHFNRVGLVDQPDQSRKIHTSPIPRVGGISIALSYVLAFLVISFYPFQTWNQLSVRIEFAQAIFFGSVIVFLSGLVDDFLNIHPWQKLAAQIVAGTVIFYSGIRIGVPENVPYADAVSLAVTVLWLVGCANAFNLIDGMDGLAAGIGLFATIAMLIAGLINNNLDLIIVTVPLAGSLLGFLRYNFNPASIFLGDCGSMLIGFLLGCFAIEWSHKSVTLLGLTAPMMALAVPLLDASLSVVRRFLRNRPIFGADRGHIHHRLLDKGLTQKQAAFVAYGISGLAATFSLVQSSLHRDFGGLIIVLFGLVVWIGIQNLGYVEFGMARRLLFAGAFGQLVDFQTKLRQFELQVENAEGLDDLWIAVRDSGKAFGFHGARLSLFSRINCEVEDGYQNSIQIRIPLDHDNYVNFYGADGQIDAVVLNSFLPVVVNSLNAKVETLLPVAMQPKPESASPKPKLVKLA